MKDTEETRPATELQFLIDLLLNHKLNPTTKKLVADRIGFVEVSLRSTQQNVPRGTQAPYTVNPDLKMLQAPSTQKILDRDGPPILTPIVVAPAAPPILATQRIIGGEVNTGGGSRGPRKF